MYCLDFVFFILIVIIFYEVGLERRGGGLLVLGNLFICIVRLVVELRVY